MRKIRKTRDLRIRATAIALGVCGLIFQHRANAAPESIAILPVLAANPEVVSKLAELPANHAALLGDASVIGTFNDTARQFDLHLTGPRARDFTLKMCWAPDRRRALYCGANHAVPHRLNDVWEFDLPALTWNMLYAPDLPRDYHNLGKDHSDVEFKDGILITKRGGPAVIAHTWWGLTYDAQNRALLFMNTWVTPKKKMVTELGGNPEELYTGPPLWAFFPTEQKWKPFKSPEPRPREIFGGMLEYVPDLGGSLWHANNWQIRSTWLHHFETDTWENLNANNDEKKFEQEAPEPEQVGYYDPTRKIIVVHRHHSTHHFDVNQNQWRKVRVGQKDDDQTPYGHDAHAVLYHDPVSGHGLLVQFQTNTLWAYDPDATQWTRLNPEGDPMPTGGKRLAYVDPALNVLVIIDKTTVWAYRYKRR